MFRILPSMNCSRPQGLTHFFFRSAWKLTLARLILILVVADVLRSFWLFAFPIANLAYGSFPTSSGLCQACGFFTQMAYEMAGSFRRHRPRGKD